MSLNPFGVKIDGVDALRYKRPTPKGQKSAPDIQIAYELEFEEREAAAMAGYSWPEYLALPGTPDWIDPENPTDSKCHVIVWYRYSTALAAFRGVR